MFLDDLDKHSHRQVGNEGEEDCETECKAQSKPHGTGNLFRRIPTGVVKCVGKKQSRHKNL